MYIYTRRTQYTTIDITVSMPMPYTCNPYTYKHMEYKAVVYQTSYAYSLLKRANESTSSKQLFRDRWAFRNVEGHTQDFV